MGGRRSLGATTSMRPARRGLQKTILGWATMLSLCASGAAVTYGHDAFAQHKKKPKKPAPAAAEIELDAPAAPQNAAPAAAPPRGRRQTRRPPRPKPVR